MAKKKQGLSSDSVQIKVPAVSSQPDEAQVEVTQPQEPKTEYQKHQEKFESKAEKKAKQKPFHSGAENLKDHPKFAKFKKGKE